MIKNVKEINDYYVQSGKKKFKVDALHEINKSFHSFSVKTFVFAYHIGAIVVTLATAF